MSNLFLQGAEESQSPPHLQNIQSPVVPQAALAPLQHLQQNPPAVSPHQMQAYPQMTQTYQQSFVNQVSWISHEDDEFWINVCILVADESEHATGTDEHDATARSAESIHEPTGEFSREQNSRGNS